MAYNTDLIEHALSAKSGKAKTPKKAVRHMHVTKAHSGGYHIRHEYDHPTHEPTEHVAADTDALHDHIEQHFGEPNPGETETAAVQPAEGGAGEEA